MKGFIALGAIVVLSLPALAFAAYNDVTLTTDALISVGGYTLNVSGSSAAVQSIVVNSGSFTVTLASGSSLTVSSPTLNQLSSDVTSDVTNNTCNGSASSISLAYSGAGTVTNVITPSATVCTTTATPSSSGGGGGVIGGPLSVGYRTPTAANTSSKDSAVGPAVTAVVSFTRDIGIGETDASIKSLQVFLNSHGFVLTPSGVGSAGHESSTFGAKTKAALKKFQRAHGIPQTGYLGPRTRAAINAILAQ